VTRLRTAMVGALCVAVGAFAAWGLAYPQNELAASLTRAVADCAGC
jgi:copper resistance protein D